LRPRESAGITKEKLVDAGRLPDRKHLMSSLARAIEDHLAAGSAAAIFSATGARLARLARPAAGGPPPEMPDHVRHAVERALAAEVSARPRVSPEWLDRDPLSHIPMPRPAPA
jgi:hypothetical protein